MAERLGKRVQSDGILSAFHREICPGNKEPRILDSHY